MQHRSAFLLILVIAGCGPKARQGPPIARVSRAEPVPENAVTLTFLPGGDFLRDEVRMRLEDVPEAKGGPGAPDRIRREPLLLEVDAGTRFEVVIPVVDRLVSYGQCANQGFLVDTPGGRGVIPLCIPQAKSPPGLLFIDGSRQFDELGNRELSHLWIDLHPAPLRVTGIRIGRHVASKFYGAKPEEKMRPWIGDRPADGAWTLDTLRSFLDRTDVKPERPILVVTVSPQDILGPCLADIAELRQLGPQVIFWFQREK